MAIELKEKLENAAELLSIIVIDSIMVLIVALITEGLKSGIEYICGRTIDLSTNPEMFYVYKTSKFLLISIFIIYTIFDVVGQIKKKYKQL